MQRDPNNRFCNHEGYPDLTAYEAEKAIIKEESKEKKRVSRTIEAMQYIANLLGFKVKGRITLIDRRTGKEWR